VGVVSFGGDHLLLARDQPTRGEIIPLWPPGDPAAHPPLCADAGDSRTDGLGAATDGGADESRPPPSSSWLWLVTLAALGIAVCYADRSNLSTAIIPMAEELSWSSTQQGLILSSFYLGYMLTQALGGLLSDRYGGKWVLAAGVVAWTAATLATPEAARLGVPQLVAARVAMGLGEGVAFPAVHALVSREVPRGWQSSAVGAVTAASYLGTAVAFGAAPGLIDRYGWPSVFYVFGATAVVWLPLWAFRGRPLDRPSHPWMPLTEEAEGADSTLPGRGPPEQAQALLRAVPSSSALAPSGPSAEHGASLQRQNATWETVWGLLRRKDVWAIMITQFCGSWGMYGLLSWLPTFFSETQGIQVSDLGGYTLVPYVVQGGVGLVSGGLADGLIARGIPVLTVRRVLQVVGMVGPAACLLSAVDPSVSAEGASAVITVGLGLSALTLGAVSVSQLDIAPERAGLVFGLGNTAGTLAGLLATPVTGLVLDSTDRSWTTVFSITAAFYLAGALVWCLWAGDGQRHRS